MRYGQTCANQEAPVMARKRYSPKQKFHVVLETLAGEKTPRQIAKEYGIHLKSAGLWMKQLLEKGPELDAEDSTMRQHERRLAQTYQDPTGHHGCWRSD